jgi:hypothetical protein
MIHLGDLYLFKDENGNIHVVMWQNSYDDRLRLHNKQIIGWQ